MTEKINVYELRKIQTDFPSKKITSSSEAANFIRQFYGDDIDIFESMFILCLNVAGETIGYQKISQGGIASVMVDIRLIAKYAIESLASSVIICHNHPAGSLSPSSQDISLTEKVQNGLKLLDIRLVDHIILTKDKYYSFRDEELVIR